jgi:hypothetical protein
MLVEALVSQTVPGLHRSMQIFKSGTVIRTAKQNGRKQSENSCSRNFGILNPMKFWDSCRNDANEKEPKHKLKPSRNTVGEPHASSGFDERDLADNKN